MRKVVKDGRYWTQKRIRVGRFSGEELAVLTPSYEPAYDDDLTPV